MSNENIKTEVNNMYEILKDIETNMDKVPPELIYKLMRTVEDLSMECGWYLPQEVDEIWDYLSRLVAKELKWTDEMLENYQSDVRDVGPEIEWLPRNADHLKIVKEDMVNYASSS